MRNLHQILLQEYGVEVRHLFSDWERLQLRASDYKNHKIFTLRYLHRDLIPVSIKLKSTLKTVKARQLIRKAEKDLLQARLKAINSILVNVTKQTEECRTQLASIISAQRLRECQGFIDKVSEIRFTKVRQRQLNKFNILINKKEGNITRANAINLTNNLPSQAGRQASTSLPPREGSNPSEIGRQAGTLLPSGERSNQAGSQAGTPRQLLTYPWVKEAALLQQVVRQVLSFPLGKEAVLPRQLLTFILAKEAIPPQQVVRQVLSFPLGKEAILPRQLLTFLPGKEAIPPQQVVRQVLSFPLGKEAVLPQQTVRLVLSFPLGKEVVLHQQLLTFPRMKEAFLPWQVNQAIELGQSGKVLGGLTGIGHPRLPRRTALSPGKTTSLLPPSWLPQGSSNEEPNPKWVINLSNKPLTPAQRSVLAKGPNFAVTPRQPPNLEYITAIEAACTKLSQQDAEELRADVNRVLKSSHPPNLT